MEIVTIVAMRLCRIDKATCSLRLQSLIAMRTVIPSLPYKELQLSCRWMMLKI